MQLLLGKLIAQAITIYETEMRLFTESDLYFNNVNAKIGISTIKPCKQILHTHPQCIWLK